MYWVWGLYSRLPRGCLASNDGKARLISDLFCDGLGACIGNCPECAIEIEEREAVAYDEDKVMENVIKGGPHVIKAHLQHLNDHSQTYLLNQAVNFLKKRNIKITEYEEEKTFSCGCPGSTAMDLTENKPTTKMEKAVIISPELSNWPVQLQLLNHNAPFLKNADLLISADCAPFAYANFHQQFLKDKILIILCPKLDQTLDQYIDKLTEIFEKQDINSITIVHMEVPCCSGIETLVKRALKKLIKT